MSESQSSENPSGENKTPTKRTPSKRLTLIQRQQLESEELIKNMGGSLDVGGGRRTRSSARGNILSTPVTPSTPATPPPAKKPRTSTTTTPRRGRPKRIDTIEVNDETVITETNEITPTGTLKTSDVIAISETKDNKLQENHTETETTSISVSSTKSTVNDDHTEENDMEITEVDAKLNSIVEETPEESIKKQNIDEHKENNSESEKKIITDIKKITTPTKIISPSRSIEIVEEKKLSITPIKSSTATITIEKIPSTPPTVEKYIEKVEATVSASKLDVVEPMEVDSAPQEITKVVETAATKETVTSQKGETKTSNSVDEESKNDIEMPYEGDVKSKTTTTVAKETTNAVVVESRDDEKLQKTTPTKQTNDVDATVESKEKSNESETKQEQNLKDQTANSIGEKPIVAEKEKTAVVAGAKIEESKKENDVCEPKISSPTSATTGEVVAAQPCN